MKKHTLIELAAACGITVEDFKTQFPFVASQLGS
jgi:hypothetical protein